MTRLWVLALMGLCPWFFEGPASAYTRDQLLTQRLDPTSTYLTRSTPHFLIHYPAQLEEVAQKFQSICEGVYQKVVGELGAGEVGTTHLVLSDHSDESSIFTFVHPMRQIFMDVSLPQMGMGLNDFGDWHEWVLTHEFTHLAHLEMRGGAYRPLATVFGSWLRPHLTMPVWEKEGLAVHMESKFTVRGRGTGTEYPMMFRVAQAEGLLPDSSFVHQDTLFTIDNKDWPWGIRPYLFGYEMIETLSKKGDRALREFLKAQASALPFDFERGLRAAGFSDFDEFWAQTLDRVKKRALAELAKIKKEPVTPLEYLTQQGHFHFGPRVSPDGRKLYLTRDHPDHENAILSYDLTTPVPTLDGVVVERTTGYQLSISRSGRFIAFDQTQRRNRYYLESDLHLFDLKTREEVGGTLGEGARDPDIHPDGKHLVYVTNRYGKNQLVENDSSFSAPMILSRDLGFERISAPRYSPDGGAVVMSIHDSASGGEDLWIWERATRKLRVLLKDGHLNTAPSWTPDGLGVIFSSDATGVSNIYLLNLKKRQVRRLTHGVGGLFFPSIDPEGKWIYAISYRGTGYDVARFLYNEGAPAKMKARPLLKPAIRAALERTPPTPYRGTGYLAPQYLMPNLSLRPGNSQFGFSTGATDPLFFQSYSLDLRYDGRARLPVGVLYYFNGAVTTAFDLTLAHDVTLISGEEKPLRSFSAEVGAHVPLSSEGNHLFLHPSVIFLGSEFTERFRGLGVGLEFRRDTTFKQIGHSFPEWGSRLTLAGRRIFSTEGGGPGPTVLSFGFSGHQALPWPRHALHLILEGASLLGPDAGKNNDFSVSGIPSFPFITNSNFTFYGAGLTAVQSRRLGLVTGLYTLSIVDIERGIGTSPFYFGRLSGGLRVQAGALENAALPAPGIPLSAGVELYQTLVFGTLFEFTAQLGAYRANPALGGQTQVVFLLKGEN